MKSRLNAVAINTTIGIIQKIITVIANLAIQIIFVRSLGKQYAGISSLFTSVLTVLSFAELGIGTAITYNLYKPIAEKNTEQIGAYMNFYSTAYKIVAFVVITAGIICCPLLPYIVKSVPDIKENILIIYLLFVADTAVSYIMVYKATFLNACQENYISSVVHTIVIVLKVIAISVLLILWKNYYAYLIVTVILTFLQNLIISYIANRKYPFLKEMKKYHLKKEEKKRVYKDVYAMSLYKVSGTVLNGTDNIIISGGLGTSYVGLMSNYNMIIRQVYDVIIQFFSSVTSSIGNLSTENDIDYEHYIFETLNFISFWIFTFASISVFIIANPFIELCFGGQYVCTLAVLSVLVIDLYVKGMMNPVSAFRTSHGLFVQGKYRPLIMAIINITLSLILLKYFGLIGVFLATIISRIVTQVWFDPYIVYKYVFKRSPSIYLKKYIKWILTALLCAVVTFLLAEALPFKSSLLFTIVMRILLCIVVPNIMIFLIYKKTYEFKKTIEFGKSILKKIKNKIKKEV